MILCSQRFSSRLATYKRRSVVRWLLRCTGERQTGVTFNINSWNSDGWGQIIPARMVLVWIYQQAGAKVCSSRVVSLFAYTLIGLEKGWRQTQRDLTRWYKRLMESSVSVSISIVYLHVYKRQISSRIRPRLDSNLLILSNERFGL